MTISERERTLDIMLRCKTPEDIDAIFERANPRHHRREGERRSGHR